MQVAQSGRHAFRKPLLPLLIGTLVGGCSAAEEPPYQEAAFDRAELPLDGRFAHLSIVSRDPITRIGGPMSVSAQFVDYRGVEGNAVRRSLGIWSPDEEQPIDACEIREVSPSVSIDDWYTSRIDLLHAGPLTVSTALDELVLVPRPLPDLLPYLRGVTYGTDSDEHPEYDIGLIVDIWSAGGDEVSPFETTLSMPEPIAITHINDLAAGSAEALEVEVDAGILILWTPTVDGDIVYITLQGEGPDELTTLSCAALDDGSFFISAEAIDRLWSSLGADTLRLTLRRARVQPIEIAGFDTAEAVAASEHSLLLY